jgi:hypothetical protein
VAKLVVQMGHCYRKTGATGTTGEQNYATAVGDFCMELLNGRSGWTVNTTLADEDDYKGDAFIAVHCDGSIHPGARGSSVGYRTPEGQAFAHAWKRAYAARGWPIFRPDNYTAALAGYYGVKHAVAAKNRRAIIIECGFLTSPDDRALLLRSGGVERVVLSIADALRITPRGEEPKEKDDMQNLILARHAESDEIWVGDGITRRHVADMDELGGLQYWIQQKGGDPTVHQEWHDLRVLGIDVTNAFNPPTPLKFATEEVEGEKK